MKNLCNMNCPPFKSPILVAYRDAGGFIRNVWMFSISRNWGFPPFSSLASSRYLLLAGTRAGEGSVVTQRLISCVILSFDNLLTGLVFHPYIPPPAMFVFSIHRACLQINKGSGAESRHKYVSLLYVGLKISTGVHTDWRLLRLESWSLDRSWWGLITSLPLPHSSQLMNHYDWYLK